VHACQRTLRWVAANAESWTAGIELRVKSREVV
jgi:hypothetical protein